MKHHYISGKKLSLWMRLTHKWNKLYSSIKDSINLQKVTKLNRLSLLLGVKSKIALTAIAGIVTLGAQAQSFTEVTGTKNPLDSVNLVQGGWPSPTFADIDQDGDLDIVCGTVRDGLYYFESDGQNNFTEQTDTNNPFDGINISTCSPTFADLDGDGDLDLISGETHGTIKYYENDGLNNFIEQTGTNNPFNGIDVGQYSSPTFADLDDDGDLDLVAGDWYGTIRYYENDGQNNFTVKTGNDNPIDEIGSIFKPTPIMVDLDDDGDLDLISGDQYGQIKYFANDGNDVFSQQTGTNNPFDGIDVGSYAEPAFADLDGDGDLDLISGERYGTIKYFENTSEDIVSISKRVELHQLNIFPNPATSIINTEKGQLGITDALGNLVLSTESNGKVDVSSLEAGIYIVTQNGKKSKLILE